MILKDDIFLINLKKYPNEFLLKLNFNNKIKNTILDIERYSFDDSKNKINREFDVVTVDKNGYISYEYRYSNHLIDKKIINEEIFQIDNLDVHFYKLGFISKKGFKKRYR